MNLPVLKSHDQTQNWIKSKEFEELSLCRNIIIGGGGLLVRDSFKMALDAVLSRSELARKTVLWGVGHNAPRLSEWRFLKQSIDLSQYSLQAIGIRDYGHAYEWVPCASCMDTVFDKKYPIVDKVRLYAHRDTFVREDFRVQLPGNIPLLTNNVDFGEAINFLGGAEIILTNSYHGAYWATLLNRRVVAFPNSSKFYDMRHSIPLCDPVDWERFAKLSVKYPNALNECRQANIEFARKVTSYTGCELSFSTPRSVDNRKRGPRLASVLTRIFARING
jgi:hypothetical protein